MKYQPARQGQSTTLGTTCPTLFNKSVVSLTSPANTEDAGDKPTVYSLFS